MALLLVRSACADGPAPGAVAELQELKSRFREQSEAAVAPVTKKHVEALEVLLRDLKLRREFQNALVVQQELNLYLPASNAVPVTEGAGNAKGVPAALQRLRRTYQSDQQTATRPLLSKYQAALDALLQRAMKNGDLAGIDAVQQEIKAVKAGTSSVSAAAAGYVDTVWAWGGVGADGVQEKITFWRDGKAQLHTTAMRYQPLDASRIRILYDAGGTWKEAYIATFDFTRGTLTAVHVTGAVIHGRYLQRARPEDR